ncbi:cell division protein ZapA [Vulcaniibacterium tengchongense]|uniref:Cell division protein ZapA n=1 Tax=Vulcaniibacterium tengchongense TaxID=1273429 RepID=A0A3N4VM50_9GAMM|nr:cell division protein ZapA [Vulcaniibacterium tengchongense]RPE74860.1 cell division protein ZapA [Vulcaniibacterium tengchongense]
MSATEPVNIRLLDREYTVGCEPGEREGLLAAARMLDAKMREIRGNNRMAGIDRIAVLAALNFAHDLQQLRSEHEGRDRELARTLSDLHRRLDDLFEAPAR